jgi:hypothetical protein
MYKTRYGEMLKGGSINAEQAKIAEEAIKAVWSRHILTYCRSSCIGGTWSQYTTADEKLS